MVKNMKDVKLMAEVTLMNKFKSRFVFYYVIGFLIYSFFLLLSAYTNAITSLMPYLILGLSLSLNYLLIRDCFVEFLQVSNFDKK